MPLPVVVEQIAEEDLSSWHARHNRPKTHPKLVKKRRARTAGDIDLVEEMALKHLFSHMHVGYSEQLQL